MSQYQVFARRWRPRCFAEMSGQTHVLQALINALQQNRLHHAYLFSGTRGVGKTTIARILAKCLNCEQGIVAEPCGQCAACKEIDAGCFIDLIEVDAASRTKVEDTRELLDNVQYLPTRGRFKIYLIDEVHMLSTHSFNALLKTLEEPPPHVKFLLATTDPQKLPVTVLSRCLQFHLKSLPLDTIEKYLTKVISKESLSAEPAALSQLAQSAKGSMRDALSLLDQAIAFAGGNVTVDDVCAMLGTVDHRYLHDLMQSLLMNDGQRLFAVIHQLIEQSPDFSLVLDELLSLLHHLALAQAGVTSYTSDQLANLDPQAFSRETIQLYYQIALLGKRDLAYAASLQSGFEMTMLRMLAFESKEQQAVMPSVKTQPNRQQNHSSAALSSGSAKVSADVPSSTMTKKVTPSQPSTASPPSASPVSAASDAVIDDKWSQMIATIGLTGLAHSLASHCGLQQVNDGRVNLLLSPQHQALLNDKSHQRLKAALQKHFGRSIDLQIHVGKSAAMTPAQLQQQQQTERQAKAYNDMEADSQVQSLADTFGATIQQVDIVADKN